MPEASVPSPPEPRRGTRTVRRRLRYAVAGLTVLGLAAYLALHYLTTPTPEGCRVRGAGHALKLNTDQAANAATIAAVGSSRDLPERAVTIALATAMQESELRNISYGDRDSLGLFQQRPSQGWGTQEQILDPVYATNEFYDALQHVPGYERLPLTVAAQRVQKSGYPEAYAKHEDGATVLAAALTGRTADALTCTTDPDTARSIADGATVDTKRLAQRVKREFGGSVGTAVSHGRTLSFALLGAGGRKAQLGSALAAWAVAHAKELRIESVVHQESVWTTTQSAKGWRHSTRSTEQPDATSSTPDPVLITVAG